MLLTPACTNVQVRDYFRAALEALAAAIALRPEHDLPLRTALTLAHKTCDFRYWLLHSSILRETFAGHLQRGMPLPPVVVLLLLLLLLLRTSKEVCRCRQ